MNTHIIDVHPLLAIVILIFAGYTFYLITGNHPNHTDSK